MNSDFNDLEELARRRYGQVFVQGEYDFFSLVLEAGAIEFFRAAGEPEGDVFIRAKILSIDELQRAGDFAKAALTGNYFWDGTRGATISLGGDDAFYLTERRSIDEIADEESLEQCLNDFTSTLGDWRERSVLYV